jgi:hypothetical protein
VDPVRAVGGTDVVSASVERLSEYSADLNRVYGLSRHSYALTTRRMEIEGADGAETLESLAASVVAELAAAQDR